MKKIVFLMLVVVLNLLYATTYNWGGVASASGVCTSGGLVHHEALGENLLLHSYDAGCAMLDNYGGNTIIVPTAIDIYVSPINFGYSSTTSSSFPDYSWSRKQFYINSTSNRIEYIYDAWVSALDPSKAPPNPYDIKQVEEGYFIGFINMTNSTTTTIPLSITSASYSNEAGIYLLTAYLGQNITIKNVYFRAVGKICAENKCNKFNLLKDVRGVNAKTDKMLLACPASSGTYVCFLFGFLLNNETGISGFYFNSLNMSMDVHKNFDYKGILYPAGLNQIFYIRGNNNNSVISVEYGGNNYVIAGGLTTGDVFYSDLGLKHTIVCDWFDPNSKIVSVIPQANGGTYILDIDSACGAGSSSIDNPPLNDTKKTFSSKLGDKCGSFSAYENETDIILHGESGNYSHQIVFVNKTDFSITNYLSSNYTYIFPKNETKSINVFCSYDRYDMLTKENKVVVNKIWDWVDKRPFYLPDYSPFLFFLILLPSAFVFKSLWKTGLLISLVIFIFNMFGYINVPQMFIILPFFILLLADKLFGGRSL